VAGNGFVIGGNDTAQVRHGEFRFTRQDGNIWICTAQLGYSNGILVAWCSGAVVLGGELDRIRITTNSAGAFNRGSANRLIEF